jgi:uncharacterized protein (UPF0333 family)
MKQMMPKDTEKKSVYQIFNADKGLYGKVFALCGKCYEEWEGKNRVIVEKIGENSPLPCNECHK